MFEATLISIFELRIWGKSPAGVFLRWNGWVWNHLPAWLMDSRPGRAWGHLLHALVRRSSNRNQYLGTFFLRNRPQQELICRLSYHTENPSMLRMAVLGCSNGAEVYSILASLRSARPELHVILHAVDISSEVLALAQKGTYSIHSPELVGESIFQRMTEAEIGKIFDREGDKVTVQSWIRPGISWHLGDVRDPGMLSILGLQDIVVANNFLCHMKPADAEACLRSIGCLVKPGGYLIVSGVDLDVRTKVANEQNWKPVAERIEEIHEGDPSVRRDWPMGYWGLEPLDRSRKDWMVRYAAVFQVGEGSPSKERGCLEPDAEGVPR